MPDFDASSIGPTRQPTDPRFRDRQFDADDFAAVGDGMWVVEANDVKVFRYAVLGRVMFIWLRVTATQIVGDVDELEVKIPGGRIAKTDSVQSAIASSGDVTFRSYPAARCHTTAGSNKLKFINALEGWAHPVELAGMFVIEI